MIINQIIPKKIYIENEIEKEKIRLFLKENKITFNDAMFEVGNWVELGKDDKRSYIVKPADTILSVAKSLNISEQELLNKIGTKNLYIGQKIDF